jgi:hypothetical protein
MGPLGVHSRIRLTIRQIGPRGSVPERMLRLGLGQGAKRQVDNACRAR